jgi:hypothetical protein
MKICTVLVFSVGLYNCLVPNFKYNVMFQKNFRQIFVVCFFGFCTRVPVLDCKKNLTQTFYSTGRGCERIHSLCENSFENEIFARRGCSQ